MSWEHDSTSKYPCPCGKGEYAVLSYSDDWGRFSDEFIMLCPQCKEKYTYSHTIINAHPGRETERGWVLKSDLIYEGNKRKEVFNRVKEQCWDIWVNKLNVLTSKKSKWSILTQDGKYYPALGTFYSHTTGYSKEQITEYINNYFDFYNINRIYEVCGIKLDYSFLDTNESELIRLFRL